MSSLNTIALLLLICAAANAFTAPGATRAPSTVLQAGRRDFLDAAMSATAGLVVATIPGIARADEEIVDDLSMPSEEEQKKAEVSVAWSLMEDSLDGAFAVDFRGTDYLNSNTQHSRKLDFCEDFRDFFPTPTSSLLHSCKKGYIAGAAWEGGMPTSGLLSSVRFPTTLSLSQPGDIFIMCLFSHFWILTVSICKNKGGSHGRKIEEKGWIAKTEIIIRHVVFCELGQGKGKAKSHANDQGATTRWALRDTWSRMLAGFLQCEM